MRNYGHAFEVYIDLLFVNSNNVVSSVLLSNIDEKWDVEWVNDR